MRPNIILITSDQHRADTMGCAGHPCVRTPHLDRLAAMGTRFTRAYADCPVCVPQRTTWVTGRQAHVNGAPFYSETHHIQRDPSQFLGSLITSAGYQSILIGKSHWHTDPDFAGGFERWIPFTQLAEKIKEHTGRPGVNYSGLGYNEINPSLSYLPPGLYSTDWAVDQALRVIEQRDFQRPLFLWLSLTDPHPPNVIHEPYYSMYRNAGEEIPPPISADWCENLPLDLASRWLPFPRMNPQELRDARAVYYGKITNIDHQLGRLFGALEWNGIWENSLVVYTSDHGEMLGDFGGSAKSCFLDAAARVPLMVRAPTSAGVGPGALISTTVGMDDLLPTLCDYAEATPPEDVTGQSWRPLLEGREGYRREFFHGHIDDSHLYYDGRYKYLYFCQDGAELVFDMDSPEGETRDLSSDKELVARLRSALEKHLRDENHPHCESGRLLNRNVARPSDRELRARNVTGWIATGANCYPV